MNYKRQLKFECSVASCVSFFLWIHLYHPLANDSFCVWMQLPAVTHVHFFHNAYKMTSRRCVSARVDSAKKHMSTTYVARGNFFIWIPGLPGNWIITFYILSTWWTTKLWPQKPRNISGFCGWEFVYEFWPQKLMNLTNELGVWKKHF